MDILLLEDDHIRVAHFRQLFAGHSIVHVEHAKDAIWWLENKLFDMILLDHDLGGTQMDFNPEDCGTMVAEFMKDNNIKIFTIIHSFNNPAAMRMLNLIPNAIYLPGIWYNKNFKIEDYEDRFDN